jgi:hypothetical protein
LVEMAEAPYETEEVLQRLLQQHPRLLGGDQLEDGARQRWILVSGEVALASEEDGGDRWKVDHLFVDQNAIPTLVEVKRSSDTRIRREVVGQMLDYAANAVVHWRVDKLRALSSDAVRVPRVAVSPPPSFPPASRRRGCRWLVVSVI